MDDKQFHHQRLLAQHQWAQAARDIFITFRLVVRLLRTTISPAIPYPRRWPSGYLPSIRPCYDFYDIDDTILSSAHIK